MIKSLPIKNIKEIKGIEKLFMKKNLTSHLLMFLLSINTGVTASYNYKDYIKETIKCIINQILKFIDVSENINCNRFRKSIVLWI